MWANCPCIQDQTTCPSEGRGPDTYGPLKDLEIRPSVEDSQVIYAYAQEARHSRSNAVCPHLACSELGLPEPENAESCPKDRIQRRPAGAA